MAAFTRFWRLGYHSFWFDEAVSLHWAGADLSYMWPVTFRLVEEKHPPVYYTLLHFWQQGLKLFGLAHNDIALRALGALLGVLTVWGVLLLAGRLSGRATGFVAGLLVALSPVLVWYSQELRMFQPATTFIVWAAYCLVRAADAARQWPRWGWWLGFIVSMEAGLYAYLFSAFVLPVMGLTLFLLFLHQTGRSLAVDRAAGERESLSASIRVYPRTNLLFFGEGLLALTITGLLFLPLALNAWGVNASEGDPGVAFANFLGNTRRLLRIFSVWRPGWEDGWTNVALVLIGLLALWGVVLPWLRRAEKNRSRLLHPTLDRWWLLCWIGGPLLIANVLLSRSGSIFAEDRYLIFMAPFVLWAVARGVVTITERVPAAGWVCGVVVVGLLSISLPRLWTPDLLRENWRAAASYIADYQDASPGLGSAAIAHISYTHRPLDWYLQQRYSFAELPVFGLFGEQIPLERADEVIGPPVFGIPKELGAATLWLTQSHLEAVDDDRVVQGWLDGHFPLITAQSPAGVGLRGYALQSRFEELPPLMQNALYPEKELVPGLHLAACEVVTPVVAATDTELHPPSGWVHVRLWWRATASLPENYLANLRVVNAVGVWGERLFRENEPLRRFPTSTWAADGSFMRDEVDVNLNPTTPGGLYDVVVGVLGEDGQTIGESSTCGEVQIVP